MVIRDPWLRALVMVMCAIAGLYLLGLVWQVVQDFADIILLFFLAWLLAFILEPVVGAFVEAAHLPRVVAIAFTYAALLVLLAMCIVLIVPALTAQLVEVARNLPTYAERVGVWVTDWQTTANDWLTDRRSPVLFDLGSALNPADFERRVEALGPPLLANAVQIATGVAALLVELVIVLILSFYFMADGGRMAETLIRALPPRAQDDTRYLVANVHRAFAGFLRSQVIQMILSGVGTGLVLWVLHVDYALLSAVIAGVILLIPFLGPVVAVGVPFAIALFTHPDVAWLVFVLLLALQQVIFNVLAPRIMSQQIGLHPLLVFFAVLAGARVAGVWGAIFGVPVIAVVVAMVSFYRASNQERAARLQEHLPGQELLSVEPEPEAEPEPHPEPVGPRVS